MLVRHSSVYLLARGAPAVINFAAIAVYTRWLSADAYGLYALVIAWAGLVSSVAFQWIRMSLVRFLPQHERSPERFLGTILVGFAGVALLAILLGAAAAMIFEHERTIVMATVAMSLSQSWFDLNTEIARSRLAPVRYGAMSLLRAGAALGLGTGLILIGLGGNGPVLGLTASMIFSSLVFAKVQWRGASIRAADPRLLKELIAYGLPLTTTYALEFIISGSDRLMLNALLGKDAIGLYSAGYDLTQFTIGVLMTIINLAAYPLAVRAFESGGSGEAGVQLQKNLMLLLAGGLPAAVGMALCAPNITGVLLGAEFRHSAAQVMPWIALSAMLWGIKAFFLDMTFYLTKKTAGMVTVMFVAAVINLGLNFWSIPRFGILGAAYSAVAAYGAAALASWRIGRKLFPLPPLSGDHVRIVIATLLMGLALWPMHEWRGVGRLAMQITAGVATYVAAILIFNVAECRQWTLRLITAWRMRNLGNAA